MKSEIFIIESKLALLVDYFKELSSLKNISYYKYQKDKIIKRGIERLLQLIVEVASDINSLIILNVGEKAPESYYDSFIALSKVKILNPGLTKKLASTAGLRNRLVHEYGEYKDEMVYRNIKISCKLYSHYIKTIQKFLDKIKQCSH